jgi:histidine triad (HIT) family protein
MGDCVFCKIVSGAFGTELLGETEHSVAFRDINPEMPVHVLVVPKLHFRDVTDLVANDEAALTDLVKLATLIANEHSIDGSFKLLFNTGENAGQTVFHAHAHVLSQMPKSA